MSPEHKTPGPRSTAAIGLLLVLLTATAYGPTLRADFLNFDDNDYVTENPAVQAGLTWQGCRWAWTTTHAANWHPLTWMSLQLDSQLFGPRPWGFHLSNVLLHSVNTLLLFLVLRRMTACFWRSAFVAALFGLHPLHVESVAWVAERKDVLSTCFAFLALWAYVRYAERPGVGRYVLVTVFFALGLLAKPMLVALPFVFLLLDYWPLGRFASLSVVSRLLVSRDNGVPARPACTAARLVGEKVPFLALSALSCGATWYAQRQSRAMESLDFLPLWARVANAVLAYGQYLVKMVWPIHLGVFYPHPGTNVPVSAAVGAGIFLFVVSLAAVCLARRFPYLLVGWLWYLGTLVPVIGLVQVGGQGLADRYTYVPLVGIFIMATWGVADLASRVHLRPLLAPAGGVVVLCCLLLTRAQAGYWKDSVTLWSHTVAVTGDNSRAEYSLGVALEGEGRIVEAMRHYREAIRIAPRNVRAHYNLGEALQKMGDFAAAIPEYQEAVRLRPDYLQAHINLGVVWKATGKPGEAAAEYRRALVMDRENAGVLHNLAVLLVTLGRPAEAAEQSRLALKRDPSNPWFHWNLGRALAQQHRMQEAVESFRRALDLEPRVAPAQQARFHCSLAHALAATGETAAARSEYALASRLDPGWPQAVNQEAWVLATHPQAGYRSGPLAVPLAEQVCQATDFRVPEALDTLAAAYAESGRWAEAVEIAHKALEVADSSRQHEKFTRGIEKRLRLYEKRLPWRDDSTAKQVGRQ